MPQCPTQVRDADRQSKDLLRKREEEEASIAETMTGGPVATGEKPLSKVPPHLLVSTYDTLRHKFAEQVRPQCPNAPMSQNAQCTNAPMHQCNNATMQQCNTATLQHCNNATMQQCNNATMQQCTHRHS